jgi:hypothetical protein
MMILSATFDVNQRSDRMDWQFLDISAVPGQPSQPGGDHWNSDIFFSAGQSFRIAFTATDKENKGLESFEILDCCLITRPQILRCGKDVLTLYAPPSPFISPSGEPCGALYPFARSAFHATATYQPPGHVQQTLQWDHSLTVAGIDAHWQMSLYMTVRIHLSGRKPLLRVFYFDPETEIGNGTTPPDVGDHS